MGFKNFFFLKMPETMKFTDTLSGHGGWVTQVATNPQLAEMLISASRDKTPIMWNLNKDDQSSYGSPMKRLRGHSHFVSDVVVSSCGNFAVSASWDKTLRLWDLDRGVTTTRFVGHKHDVLSVAFSADNRQIISSSRDKTLKLWNTLGETKWTQDSKDCHQEWVSTVRFSPTTNNPVIVSGGWDKVVKVWHLGENSNNPLHQLDGGEEVSTLVFSPNRYWLCAASGPCIKIWDLEHKKSVEELKVPNESDGSDKPAIEPKCLSLAWSTDGQTLYAGYSDNKIRVWELQQA